MNIDFCFRCNLKIPKPVLKREDKDKLRSFIDAGTKLMAIQYLKNHSDLELKECKTLTDHINVNYGRCHRCNYDKLKNEYEVCPQCKSLNVNWK